MAGASLGSAEFVLRADAAELIRALDDSEKKVKATTAKIAQDLNVSERAVTQAANKIAAEQDKIAKATAGAGSGFGNLAKGALAFGVAAAGIATGAALAHEALGKIATDTQAANQALFALGFTFKGTTKEMQAFAEEQAKVAGKSNTDAVAALNTTRILITQFGYTNEQIKEIAKRSADLAALTGSDLAETTRDVVAAMRLEGDVAEKYGLSLQQDAVQARLLTKAERERYQGLDPLSKSQITYQQFLDQTNSSLGAAERRTKDAAGASSNLKAATDNLAVSIGKNFAPAVADSANVLARAATEATRYVDAVSKLPSAQDAAEKSMATTAETALSMLGPLGQLAASYLAVRNAAAEAAKATSAAGGAAGPQFGPTPAEVQTAIARYDQLAAARRDLEGAEKELADAGRKGEAAAQIKAAQDEHDREVAALDEQKIRYEVEREAKLKAVEDKKTAALDAIEAESRAAAEASEAEINRLQAQQQAAERAVAARHDDVIAALEAEQKATEDATTENIRNLEIQRDAAKQASEDTRDAAIDALDAEKRARDAARTEEDRAAEDSARDATRREGDRHEAAVEGFDAEVKAANAAKDSQLRDLDELARSQQDKHERRLRHLADEADAARDQHDARAREIDDEGDRQAKRHDAAVRAIEDEGKAAQDAHDAVSRRLSDEADAAKVVHDLATRRIEDDQRAATDAHDRLIRQIADEGDAAERVHDRAIRAIEDQADAEDDRHRAAMDALDDEQDRRQDAIDQQLEALDLLDRADQQAAQAERLAGALEGAKRGVQKAESSGNLSEIEAANRDLAAAQKAIIDSQTKNARDATRDQLKAQKDAIKDEIDARKDAEDERNRILKDDLDAEKRAADDRLKLVKDELSARKQAADDGLDLVQAGLAAQRRAADDELRLVQEGLDARKRAADDEFRLVTGGLEARRRALDDQFKQDQDRRTDAKRELDDQLKRALDRIDREKDAEDAAFDRAKDRLDKRKLAVADANKHELDAIADRKAAEDDAHDNAVRQAQDQATQEKRAIADRRAAEDLADRDKRDLIQAAFENEARDRKARYDDEATGEIPALRRALAAAQDHFRQRKTAADTAYADEQTQIKDTYTHPETGLIPLAQKAARDVATSFRDQAAAVTAAAAAEKAAIDNQYTNAAKTGLLDYLERARADSEDKLDKQKGYWQSWSADVGSSVDAVRKKVQALIDRIKEIGGQVEVDGRTTQHDSRDDDSGPHEGGRGPGPGVGGNTVPDPYQVSFPFGARYSNPFNPNIPVHRGVDVTVKGAANGGKGSPVSAFEDGQVVYDSFDPNGGNGVIIRGSDGLYHRYFHFDSTSVDVGQRVRRGDVIGRLGETGTEGSPHLHYEVSRHQNGDSGDLIDPVPYMNSGGASSGGSPARGGRTIEFDLFGHHYVIRLPGGAAGSALIRAIEHLGADIGGRDFGRAAAAIALSEGADGDLSRPGAGGARGPFQFDPGGELRNYARYLHTSMDEAGDDAGAYPLEAAAWALKGYLGDAIKDGLEQHLRGADLADYGSRYGQRPYGDNWRRAGDAHRELYGYERGGWIDRPTLLVDERTSQPYARAGEGGHPEWVGRVGQGGGGRMDQMTVDIRLDNQTKERWVFEGINLNVRRGNLSSRVLP